MRDYDARLAELDAIIVENDRADGPAARLLAADAVYKKAEIIESRDGPAAAAALYADVAQRLEGVQETEPREVLIYALNDLAHIYKALGQEAESRAMAEKVVTDHFDDPPPDVTDLVVSSTLLLVEFFYEADQHDRALALLDRLIECYGQPGIQNHELNIAAAQSSAASILGSSGRQVEGIRLFARVIEELGDPVDEDARRILANAMGKQAELLYEIGDIQEGDARCRQLVVKFGGEPELAEQVSWAKRMLEHSRKQRRKPFGRRR